VPSTMLRSSTSNSISNFSFPNFMKRREVD
jgi:hypothetical protein